MLFSSRYFALVVCSWVLCLWLLGRCEVLTVIWLKIQVLCSVTLHCLVHSSEQFDGLEMKALQSLEMMGTAHSLMLQHHILEDLNLQCFIRCANLYIPTGLFFGNFTSLFLYHLFTSSNVKIVLSYLLWSCEI